MQRSERQIVFWARNISKLHMPKRVLGESGCVCGRGTHAANDFIFWFMRRGSFDPIGVGVWYLLASSEL